MGRYRVAATSDTLTVLSFFSPAKTGGLTAFPSRHEPVTPSDVTRTLTVADAEANIGTRATSACIQTRRLSQARRDSVQVRPYLPTTLRGRCRLTRVIFGV